jgi:hypothetical protein
MADYAAYRAHEDLAPRDTAGKKLYSGPDYERHRGGFKPHLDAAKKACEAFFEQMCRASPDQSGSVAKRPGGEAVPLGRGSSDTMSAQERSSGFWY